MTVTAVEKDPAELTLTLTAEFEASPERIWQLWSDPRQLERWWGPPGYPATFTRHDLVVGTRTQYYMTTPEGETPRGYWDIVEVDPPRRIVMNDGFAKADGSPDEDMPGPGVSVVTIQSIGNGRTRMVFEGGFPSTEAMEQLLEMGMEQGLADAVGQIDAILAEDAVPAR
ncbi:MAG: SRPBCC domain-containing protein [Chloroflexota bacterium]